MVGMKITLPRDGRQKNNWPKGGTARELDGRHKITRQMDGWMAQKLLAKGMDRWTVKWLAGK